MPYKDAERRAAYLRRWRQKRQQERIKQSKHIARLLFLLYLSDNPRKHKGKVRQLLPLVFGRVLDIEEEKLLLNHFDFSPQKFLESLAVLWRENYRRDVTPLEFVEGILLSPSAWEPCPECGRPFLEDTRQ